ncbi:MAG: J domain-containing protein [Paracoccus denitrificans]|uniref:J domain-containing protein n=1 Tax=Paracoccus denitrificans TaxID=266 RepID=A0A533I3V5_PARDE|nr:MAG: J domain-containing protein [Paracoccus denitrificans]
MIIPGWSIVLGAVIIAMAIKAAIKTKRTASGSVLVQMQHEVLLQKDKQIAQLQHDLVEAVANLKAERIDRNAQVTKLNKLWVSYCVLETKLNTKEAEWLHAYKGASQFTQDEIKALIRLCHPDKHNGSEAATRLTGKLLEMRK